MKFYLLLIILLLFIIKLATAQSGLKLPEGNPELAKEKYVLLTDHYDSQEYKQSYEAFLWIRENAADMHESVYIIGLKTIKKLIEEASENQQYKYDLMQAYDLRIEHFGNEVNVLNRKAFDAYKYFRNDPAMINKTIETFNRLYKLEKNDLKDNLLYPYFDLNVIERKNNLTTDEELIESYQKISEIINSKLESGANENLNKTQKMIDAKLVDSIPLDCERIQQLFVAKNGSHLLNLQQAKLILKLSIAYSCTQEPYFVDAIKVLYDNDPKTKLAKIIASHYVKEKEYDLAFQYYQKSLGLTEDPNEKAQIYYDMASVYSSTGDKVKAREMAYKSLKLNPSDLNNYRLIGDLYYNSFDTCKKDKSRVKDRSVFLAAYEKYVLAKDPHKIKMAEQQFPSMESIHTENFEVGQSINTNCWIGENVKIRRRPTLVAN